jgi:coenzyme F420 hydrogenase subunit beta
LEIALKDHFSNHMPCGSGAPKTFSNLIQEVQNQGCCTMCGGCVSFCTAVNYGALGLDADGRPGYADSKKCIECGICYLICPARDQLANQTRQRVGWSKPMGRVMDVSVARASDEDIWRRGTDGGVVTALLLHLLDTGRIDGAIVTQRYGLFKHRPHLACNRQEIIQAAGSYFDTSQSMALFGNRYSTFSPSVQAFKPLVASSLRRIAFVGVPCQIKTLRKMQALKILPAETVHLTLGLFCSGNFDFSEAQRQKIAQLGGFSWEDARAMNLRETLNIEVKNGRTARIALDLLAGMRRTACKYCSDYSAELADLSFGGVGAPEAWTTAVVRTPVGRAALRDAMGRSVREYLIEDDPHFARTALEQIQVQSDRKKEQARKAKAQRGKVHNFF